MIVDGKKELKNPGEISKRKLGWANPVPKPRAVEEQLSEADIEKVSGGMCNPGNRPWLTEVDCCISNTDIIALTHSCGTTNSIRRHDAVYMIPPTLQLLP